MNDDYKIKNFKDIFSNLLNKNRKGNFSQLKNQIVKLFTIIDFSSNKSKLNFFFQSINFVILWCIILIILPDRFEQLISGFKAVNLWYLPIGQLILALASFILVSILGWLFELSWSDIFTTAPKITFIFLLMLLLIIALLYKNLILKLFNRVKTN